ncbi:MAG: SGNH/GDSL hydrolase family protein [Gammaproteobacteria bacterium]
MIKRCATVIEMFLFIGGNDVRNARDADEGHQAQSMLHEALQGVREAVISLTQSGARTFLLINAPDIGAIPETRLMADSCGDDRVISRAHSLSQQYRAGLHHLARSLRFQMGRDIEIIEFDLFGYFRNLLDQADRLGLVYTREACFSQQTQRFHPACQNGENADQFVFFDEIHPTALVHERVGKALARIVLRQSALRYGAPRHGEQRRYAQCGLRFDHDFSYGNRLFRHNIWHSIRY